MVSATRRELRGPRAHRHRQGAPQKGPRSRAPKPLHHAQQESRREENGYRLDRLSGFLFQMRIQSLEAVFASRKGIGMQKAFFYLLGLPCICYAQQVPVICYHDISPKPINEMMT